jgi:hypothetical protein
VTPEERTRAEAIGQGICDRIELRILKNLIGMLEDHVPPDQIGAYLDLEREQLNHWLDHDLEPQLRAWVATWPEE